MVDLHRTVAGIGASPNELWSAFTDNAEEIQIGATRIMVPRVTARALTVVLHAGFHGGRGSATGDLERLLNRLGRDEWTEVVALAYRLQAIPALAAGLRQLREGAALADSLGLPDRYPLHTTLLASATSGVSLNLEWLLQLDGTKAKLAFAVRRLVPPVAVMRGRSSLARRGRVGLAIAYVLRPLRILWQLLPALLALRLARSRALDFVRDSAALRARSGDGGRMTDAASTERASHMTRVATAMGASRTTRVASAKGASRMTRVASAKGASRMTRALPTHARLGAERSASPRASGGRA